MELRNRVALITGASRGIGKSLALAFAAEGANLFLTARRKDLLEEVAEMARRHNVEAEIFAGDVREEAHLKASDGLRKHAFEREKILRFPEDHSFIVGAVEDVIHQIGWAMTKRAWHRLSISESPGA